MVIFWFSHSFYIFNWNSSVRNSCPFSHLIYSIIYFYYYWCRYSLCSVGYNLNNNAQIIRALAICRVFQAGSYALSKCPDPFKSTLLFLRMQDAPASSCVLPAPFLEIMTFLRSCGSFYWKIVFWNQDLGIILLWLMHHCYLTFSL